MPTTRSLLLLHLISSSGAWRFSVNNWKPLLEQDNVSAKFDSVMTPGSSRTDVIMKTVKKQEIPGLTLTNVSLKKLTWTNTTAHKQLAGQSEPPLGERYYAVTVDDSPVGYALKDTPTQKQHAKEARKAGALIQEAVNMRKKWREMMATAEKRCKGTYSNATRIDCRGGLCVPECESGSTLSSKRFSWDDFMKDYDRLRKAIHDPIVVNFAKKRLSMLDSRYRLYFETNNLLEEAQFQEPGHGADISSMWKVDNHIHLAGAMTSSHLRDFMQRKIRSAEERKRKYKWTANGKTVDGTLGELFDSEGLTIDRELTLTDLDVTANGNSQQGRFDKFNAAFSPMGKDSLRKLFLKVDNSMNGEYFADLLKEMCDNLNRSHDNILVEWRLSVYGSDATEFQKNAKWLNDRDNFCQNRARWLLQVPRIYRVWKKQNKIANFGQMISNVWKQIMETAVGGGTHEAGNLLQNIVGIDSVDDESGFDPSCRRSSANPEEVTGNDEPCFAYHLFWLYANTLEVNQVLREHGRQQQLQVRPHCGEAGPTNHLFSCYLLADGISHGLTLDSTPAMQYLYYLEQVPISMSPSSNKALFIDFSKHPVFKFRDRGLNVAVSTDDPLVFHFERESHKALNEEYSLLIHGGEMTYQSLAEMIRNSVRMSGFTGPLREEAMRVADATVPHVRLRYRQETLEGELQLISRLAQMKMNEKKLA